MSEADDWIELAVDDPIWDRWQEIDRLFEAALDQPAAERPSFLEAQCPNDRELIDQVLRLIHTDKASAGLLESPAVEAPSEFIDDLASRSETSRQIGRYTLRRPLGRGGMGTVYLAEYEGEDFQKLVALKVLRRGLDTDDVLRRFVTERRILAQLDEAPPVGYATWTGSLQGAKQAGGERLEA